jgi:DNA-binding NtrC family response regulator
MAGRVLIIDDDRKVRGRLRQALEQEGLEVSDHDPSGRPAAHHFDREYDVVLVDVVMPEKDGLEYLRDIRRLRPGQRLIAYTHGLSDYTGFAVKLGADAGIDISHPRRLRELVETARRIAGDPGRTGGSGNP